MQTFLPYPSFVLSAEVLDDRRLGKQRVEAMQILNALKRESGGWVNHPAVKMWRGHEEALQMYHDTMITVWIQRGFRNTMKTFKDRWTSLPKMPPWLGNEAFHRSHRSNLLRKDLVFYGSRFTDVGPDLPYVWPVSLSEDSHDAL
jgi:hypothetical protein